MQKSDNLMKERQVDEYGTLKYTVIDGLVCIDFVYYFKNMFPYDRLHYAHVNYIDNGSKVIEIDGIKFAPFSDVATRLATYNLKRSQYQKKPENYENYVAELKNPDVYKNAWKKFADNASEKFGIKVNDLEIEFKDLSYLNQEASQEQSKKRQPVLKIDTESQDRIKKLRDQIKLLEDQQINDQTNIGQLKKELQKESQEVAKFKNQFDNLKKEKSKDQEELNRLKRELAVCDQNAKEMEKKYEDAQRSVRDFERKQESSKDFEKKLRKDIENYKKLSGERYDKIREIEEENAKMKGQHKEKIEAFNRQVSFDAEKIDQMARQIADNEEYINSDKFAFMLKKKSTKTFVAFAAIIIFLPFTVMALKKFIAIETVGVWQDFFVWTLCVGMGIAWDAAILIFAKNGKTLMSTLATLFQGAFIAAKFDFFARLAMLFVAPASAYYFQEMIVIFCIVVYAPLIVNQFTHMSRE